MILKLNEDITSEKLIKAGFKNRSNDKRFYILREYLYKDTIALSITIDLNEEDNDKKVKWHVIDGKTNILPMKTVYFSRGGEKSRIERIIRDHVFCNR